jgi:hypothetical protein
MAPPSMRLVVPYFGPRPPYFPLVVRSMARNPDVEWLLLTDEPVPDAPPNLTVTHVTFDQLAARIRQNFEFEVALDHPYKLCDVRPMFGEIFADELAGFDFWGHCDLDVIFGQIRDHLPAEAYEADKILIQGNFALYRNTPEAARWYRHEVGRVSYRQSLTDPRATHFDEMAGIRYVLEDLGVRCWNEPVIFDISFHRYRTRAEHPAGTDARRYAWEDGEVAEYRWEGGGIARRTALLIHLQKRTMRAPSAAVVAADRFWIHANRFRVQRGPVTRRDLRSARLEAGPELLPFYARRIRRWVGRQAARRAERRAAA